MDGLGCRARGLGAALAVPLTSGAEENLLYLAKDPYKGESIFLHEFAHSIKALGIVFLDPSFAERLEAAYDAAMQEDLWDNTYVAVNLEEYWAEGVQSYFDVNLLVKPSNGIKNFVETREKLKSHDPIHYEIVEEKFSTNWRLKFDF